MTEFGRGERVEIIKSGPLSGEEGTVLLADPIFRMYCVLLDDPVDGRRIVVLQQSSLMQGDLIQ